MLAPDHPIEEPDMHQRNIGHRPRNSLLREFIAILTLSLAIVLLFSNFSGAAAQETKNPLAGNAKALQEGASQFRSNCALCHGLHAQGGSRGPDLTRGVWNHGGSDADIFRTITQGVSGTLMPANDLSDAETWEIIAYLRSLNSAKPKSVPGDRKTGEKLFFGDANCSLCHMVDGKGGRLGPDLSRVGNARSPEYLAAKIRDPNRALAAGVMEPGLEWPREYQTVTVVTRDSQSITGVLRNEDSFSIQFMDQSENLRLYLKKDLQSVTHEQKTLMPAFGEDILDNSKLHDLVAYLDSLRQQVALK
jgi:putative heme-binding domain-containing protein